MTLCPYCGSEHFLSEADTVVPSTNGKDGVYRNVCAECGKPSLYHEATEEQTAE